MAEYIKREAINRISFTDAVLIDGEVRIEKIAIVRDIENLPAADVAPVRHGSWLPQVVLGQKAWDCSECKTLGSPQWRWCPVCGAKMDGERKENENG